MNFGSLYTQAGNTALVNDTNLAKAAVNDAIREIIIECAWSALWGGDVALTGGQWQYGWSQLGFASNPPLRVWYMKYSGGGSQRVIPRVTVEEIIEMQAVAGNVGTTIGNACYAIAGLDGIFFQPTPSAGDTVQIYSSADFTDISLDATVPTQVPKHLHYVIVWIAARNLAIITNPASVNEFEPLVAMGLARCKQYANTWMGRRAQMARVGLPDGIPVRAESQYYTGDG